jgi:UPF0755 protein
VIRAHLVLLAALVGACGEPGSVPREGVTIPPGATLDAAVDSLAAHGVVQSPFLFRAYARVNGLRGALKSGDYVLRRDAPWRDVVAALARGRGAEVRWTVPEGLMLDEVAELAQTELGVPAESVRAAVRDPALARELGVPPQASGVDGYLYPTTYILPVHVGAHDLVRIMTREFLAEWQAEWDARLDSLHLTRHELVTLASIIEAEVRYDPDRAYVSAVYHNRLARGMKLEADPTVIYAYGRRLKRVWDKNLRVASPYNTYLHAGLPPGPIAEPGRASLWAALYPADVPFLYFVAQPDGKHIFSVTMAEHEAAIRAAKQQRSGARGQPTRGR